MTTPPSPAQPTAEEAARRVHEFLRQWAMMRDKSDVIYEVLADPSKDEITDLHVSDLRALLDAVQAQGVQDNEGPPRDPDGYLSRPIRRDYR